MILTCPECASRYFVDDARVGPNGRTVRCASCGASWRADASPAASTLEPALALTSKSFAPAPEADDHAADAAPLPKRIRAEAVEKKKTREAVAAGVVWAGLGAGFVALVLAAVLLRVDVVRLWPQTASAYAFARMPVNPTGLSLEAVQGQPNLIGGHAALSVTGVERNVETHARASMPLRVILYDKAGKRLTSTAYAPPTVQIPAGDARAFGVNFIDPPPEGSTFVVEFAFDTVAASAGPKKAARLAPGVATARLALRGPVAPPPPPLAAQEAKSLPSTSPYALPSSAGEQTTSN